MRLKLYRGKWAAIGKHPDGRPWRRSLGTADRAAAERRFRDIRPETPGETIADAIGLYLAEKRGRASSYHSMETAWRALRPTFGHLRPDQVTRDLCREYADMRRHGGVSNGTIIKDLGVLKAALKWAGKAQGAAFEMPEPPPPREYYITREELNRLVDAATLPHVKLFILLAWSTAARASALFDLTWGQIDFEREQIRLSKGEGRRKGRATVSMTDRAKTALESAYNARTCQHVIEWGGGPVKSVKRAFEGAAIRASLPDVTPHVLRHSAAVAMAEDGQPMEKIAQVLGHTDPRVTFRVYARYSPGHLKRVMRALE